jgi:aminoglycoside phosphotransferase (APT) family kinase protein
MPNRDPWTAEHEVGIDLATALVRAAWPGLELARVTPFGAGWDNTAYLFHSDRGPIVFRFPRRQLAVPLIEREVALLPAIAAHLPLDVPVPEWIGRPEERFPWPFAGYRLLDGRTACRAALTDDQRAGAAETLARFLAALHAFPASRAAALSAPGDELGRVDVAARAAKTLPVVAELCAAGWLDVEAHDRLAQAITQTPAAAPTSVALLHGDLYARHLLVDAAGAPTGVIDWGDIHLGHVAVDLALAFELLPPSARDTFRAAYGPVDDATWSLARFRAIYHAANILRYAHRIGDPDLAREASLSLSWI